MNEFSIFFLIVSVFAFNAFCMVPAYFDLWSPPPPEEVEKGECFFVDEITGGSLLVASYTYHLICPQKLPDNEAREPQCEKNWYFVGALKGFKELSRGVPSFTQRRIKQSLIKLTFLDDTMVKFMVGLDEPDYKITFQCFQQSQAFYKMMHHDVNMIEVASKKIGVLHEMTTRGNKRIGKNAVALCKRIEDIWYITFRDELGEPLLVFSQFEAAIMRVKRSKNEKLQLLFQMNIKYYILTFSTSDEATGFSKDLLKYVTSLYLSRVDPDVIDRFENNQIEIDSPDLIHFL